MVHNPFNMKYIFKRERYLTKRKSIQESAQIPDLSGNHSTSFFKNKIEPFLQECYSWKDAISVLESFQYNDEIVNLVTTKIVDDIIPITENSEFASCENRVNSSNSIDPSSKKKILEAVDTYRRADRILKNHKAFEKRYDLSDFTRYSDKDKCYRICEMAQTYTLSNKSKFNVALEEMSYLNYIYQTNIPCKVIVENVLDNFIMRSDCTGDDMVLYRKAIRDSKVLTEDAADNVKYFTEGQFKDKFQDTINRWKANPNKNIHMLANEARANFGNSQRFNKIISVMNEYCKINNVEFDSTEIIPIGENFDLSRKEAENILSFIESNNLYNIESTAESIKSIWEAKVNEDSYCAGCDKASGEYTAAEVDKVKMHNLVSDATETGKMLDQAEKNGMNNEKTKVKKVDSVDPEEAIKESTFRDYVDRYGYISIPIRSYIYEGDIKSAVEMMDKQMKSINNRLYNSSSVAYYTITEGCCDVFTRSKYKVILTWKEECNQQPTLFDKLHAVNLEKKVSLLEEMAPRMARLTEVLNSNNLAATIDPDEAKMLYEMGNPFIVSNGLWSKFMDKCSESNSNYEWIREACQDVSLEPFQINEVALERLGHCDNLISLLEKEGKIKKKFKKIGATIKEKGAIAGEKIGNAAAKTKEAIKAGAEKTKDIVDSARDFSARTFSDLQLTWQAAKAKFKDLSGKEQQMSQNLDMQFNHLVQTVKGFINSGPIDKRTSIITGQITFSLSRLLKTTIGMSAVGVAVGSVIPPIIGAVALFYRNKKVTDQERIKIIDELDVELQVLQKEIDNSSEADDPNKRRQMLLVQKELQRQRQKLYSDLGLGARTTVKKPENE